jgi:alkaline phosphatase D
MTISLWETNSSPYAGLQFFGEVNIDRHSKALTVDLKDIDGDVVYGKTLRPKRGNRSKYRD